MRKLLFGLALAACALGCGGGDDSGKGGSGSLDCAWLAGDNCWKTTMAAAAACVPDSSSHGTLSADGKSCTYASGTNISFKDPVVLPINEDPGWHFSETTSTGEPCLTYDQDAESTPTVTVKGMTFTEKTSGLSLQVTCPDGSQYVAPNAINLLSCDGFFADAPGYEYSYTDTSVTLGISNGTDTPLQAFDCETVQ